MKRPLGRPPLDRSGTPPASVHLKLPARDYDSAYKLATQRRESVQTLLRRGLHRLLTEEKGGSI